ncbi:envelope glycoprotein I [Ateline alphaherpesvirus 1]|uniref:Envelope glycoprotein I n=1 Tax=Herpesvirus ateles type 1 (strain Lennette) TaxID=35243 RepID=A0A1S6JLS4_HSVA1|nr:envelope glycoprotein I [Ateline alphaherpesvirus 1]AQS79224.1 envelope glycoprotein I [Ateline alphaherpesvirus 1]
MTGLARALALLCFVWQGARGLVLRGAAVSFYAERAADAAAVGPSGTMEEDVWVGGRLLFLETQTPTGAPYNGSVELLHWRGPCPRVVAIRRLSLCSAVGGKTRRGRRVAAAVEAMPAFADCRQNDTTVSAAYDRADAFPGGLHGVWLRNATVGYAGLYALRVWVGGAGGPDVFFLRVDVVGAARVAPAAPGRRCGPDPPAPADAVFSGSGVDDGAADTRPHALSPAALAGLAAPAAVLALALAGLLCRRCRRQRRRIYRPAAVSAGRSAAGAVSAVVNEEALARLNRELTVRRRLNRELTVRRGLRSSIPRGRVSAVPPLGSIAEEHRPVAEPDPDPAPAAERK